MSRIFGFFSVAFICEIAFFSTSAAHASSERSLTAPRPYGHIAVDVTLRDQPRLNARAITDLETGTPVRIVPARVEGWIHVARPANGWIPSETFTRASAEDTSLGRRDTAETADGAHASRAHRQAGLGHLAKAPRPPEVVDNLSPPAPVSGVQEHSDTDLMAAALGDSPNAARIARVVNQTTIESRRNRAAVEAPPSVWKDPFADDSAPPVAVPPPRRRAHGISVAMRAPDPEANGWSEFQLSELRAARREIARVRAEAVAARADAEAARAEAARAGCDVAVPVRRAPVARAAWRDAGLGEEGRPERVRQFKETFPDLRKSARPASERRAAAQNAVFSQRAPAAEPSPSGKQRNTIPSSPSAPAVASPEPPAPSAAPPPSGSGAWTKGILVVPITPLKRPTR